MNNLFQNWSNLNTSVNIFSGYLSLKPPHISLSLKRSPTKIFSHFLSCFKHPSGFFN